MSHVKKIGKQSAEWQRQALTTKHADRAAALTPKATHTSVDKMISFTTTEQGDMIVQVLGADGSLVATRVIPEIEWTYLRKVAH